MGLSKEEIAAVLRSIDKMDREDVSIISKMVDERRAAFKTRKPRKVRTEADPETKKRLAEFSEGETVVYAKRRGEPIEGTVEKITGKAIIFRGNNGVERRVGPEQLQHASA